MALPFASHRRRRLSAALFAFVVVLLALSIIVRAQEAEDQAGDDTAMRLPVEGGASPREPPISPFEEAAEDVVAAPAEEPAERRLKGEAHLRQPEAQEPASSPPPPPPPEQEEPTEEELLRRYEERAKAKGKRDSENTKMDYTSIKEDYVCRACMELTTAFFEHVLAPAAVRYSRFADEPQGGPGAYRFRKESMVAEVHEAIDGLCDRLKAKHKEEIRRTAIGEAPELLVGGRKNTYDGVDTVCAAALEDLDEPFSREVFKALMPKSVGEDGEEASADGSNEGAAYALPTAGVFCEKQKLCTRYLHYHISSHQMVDAMVGVKGKLKELRQREAEWKRQNQKGSDTADGNGKERRPSDDEFFHRESDANTTIGYLFSHPVELFQTAAHALLAIKGDVLSGKFWWMMRNYLVDDAVWFHMAPQWKYLVGGAIAVLSVSMLMAVCMVCVGCAGTLSRSRRHPARKDLPSPADTRATVAKKRN